MSKNTGDPQYFIYLYEAIWYNIILGKTIIIIIITIFTPFFFKLITEEVLSLS